MQAIKFCKINKKPTAVQKLILKKELEFDAELDRKGLQVFPTLALALYELFGWKKSHILELLSTINRVYEDCMQDTNMSMIQMCYEETGINVSNQSEKNWDELYYLSQALWEKKLATMKDFKTQEQQDRFILMVRTKQIAWIEPTLYASVFIAMHRREKFGYDRNLALYEKMKELISIYKPSEIIALVKANVDIDIEVFEGKFRYGNKEEE